MLLGGFKSIQDYVATVDEISNRYSTTLIIAMIDAILDYFRAGLVNPDGTPRYVHITVNNSIQFTNSKEIVLFVHLG